MRHMLPILVMFMLAMPSVIVAEEVETPALSVVEIVVAAGFDREARTPTDVADSFPAGTDRLWCYTRVMGAQQPLDIVHAWYHEGETRARVSLPVRSADWRTWSRKGLLPGWTGQWVVKVLDPDGLVLATRSFTIAPPQEAVEEME